MMATSKAPGARSTFGRALLSAWAAFCVLSCGLAVSFDRYDTSTPTFALRGTVDGLSGVRAGLSVNGSPPVLVDNGDFQLDGVVVDGTNYAVTATAPGHVCTIDRAIGFVRGADATGVLVHCLSSDATLASLVLSGVQLAPLFDPAVLAYQGVLPWQQAQTVVTAVTHSPLGHYSVNDGGSLASGTASQPYGFPSTLSLGIEAISPDRSRSSLTAIAGVNGEQLSTSAEGSGAAYLF